MRRQWRKFIGEPGWALLPLRGFLALVFLDAGIDKFTDPGFLNDGSPRSLYAAVDAARSVSPVGGLLGPVQAHTSWFGIAMAVGEIAVGIGILLGLFTRVAAAGGMALSVALWLTVSWNAHPWFTSADLVYLFAFTPLLLAGAGAYSLDSTLAAGLAGDEDDRRTAARRSVIGALAALAGVVTLGAVKFVRASAPPQDSSAGRAPSQVLVPLDRVPVGGGVQVAVPTTGEPVWVLQPRAGDLTAFQARCPHQGCVVSLISPATGFVCPCHQSHFDAQGARLDGPAQSGLTPVAVHVADANVLLS